MNINGCELSIYISIFNIDPINEEAYLQEEIDRRFNGVESVVKKYIEVFKSPPPKGLYFAADSSDGVYVYDIEFSFGKGEYYLLIRLREYEPKMLINE
jgi:hypothetical protein